MNFRVSRARTAGLLLLGIAMMLLAYFAATHSSGYREWLAWFGVPFFAVGCARIARQLFNNSVMVRIDAHGITATRIGHSPILWSEIRTVSIGSVRSTRLLCVWLVDEQGYLRTLSAPRAALARANHSMGFPAVTVSFQGLEPGVEEAFAEARKYVPERVA